MGIDPTVEIRKGVYFLGLILAWMVYLFFEPFSALITAAFLMAAVLICFKK